MHFSDQEALTNLNNTSESMFRWLGLTVSLCPVSHILAHSLPANLIADQHTHLPDTLQTLLNHFTPLLLAPNRPTQLAAYRILNR